MWYISVSKLSGLSKIIIYSYILFCWFTWNTFWSIPFIFNFSSHTKYMIFTSMRISSLSNIFNFSDRILREISIIFNIFSDKSCSWEFISSEIRLNAIFSSICNNNLFFTENMIFRVEFPIVISIFLLTELVISMSVDV